MEQRFNDLAALRLLHTLEAQETLKMLRPDGRAINTDEVHQAHTLSRRYRMSHHGLSLQKSHKSIV